MSECNICVESYAEMPRGERKPITCVKCDLECCKACFVRYITDLNHPMRCMGCSVEFDRTSIIARLGQKFMNTTYRDIRQDILYEQEKAYFPATQQLIEKELEIEKLRHQRNGLDKKFKDLKVQRMVPLIQFRKSDEVMSVREAIDTYMSLKANVEATDEQLYEERARISEEIMALENNNSKATKRTYVLACTNGNCKGMLSNESRNKHGNYVCSICDTTTCCECQLGIVSDNHDCDPDVLKTVEYMKSSSKPCPSCGVPIHKISGCNQMFCTSCHASFDWRTMRLNSGNVHNPHHAEWLRETHNRPREIQDVQCGREPSVSVAMALDEGFLAAERIAIPVVKTKAEKTRRERIDTMRTYLFNSMRWSVHHHHISIPSLGRDRSGVERNQHWRILLLKGEIDEALFKKHVQQNDKADQKRNELLHVVMLWRDALADLTSPFLEDGTYAIKTLDEWLDLVHQVEELEKYVNGCFYAVSKAFNSTCYIIADDRNIRA